MKLTLKIKLACAFGILILLFAGLYSVVLRKITEVQTQFSFVIEHDARMITDAQQLLKRVIDMETAQRTFCMTDKPDLNQPKTKKSRTQKPISSSKNKNYETNPFI